MADTGLPGGIYLKNMSGEEVEYAMPQGLTVTTVDGSTKDFINEDLIDKLPEVTEADNGKVFGVVNGKWQAMEAPTGSGGSDLPEVTDSDNGKFLGVSGGAWKATNVPAPSSYPSSQVTGLAPVATSGVYESLYYAPVGPKYVIPTHDVKFERNDKGMWRYATFAEYAPSVGTECEVEWNKETFLKTVRDCSEVASLAEEGYAFIGNAYIFTGEDTDNTGEEFLFVILHQQWPLAICYTNYRNAINVSIDFRITVSGQVKKLDKQYLPDGIATEQFVKDAVSGAATTTDVFPETVVDGFEYNDTFAGYVTDCTSDINLQLGDRCRVSWDGQDYSCEVKSIAFDGQQAQCVGNTTVFGGSDTGEPFAIAWQDGFIVFFTATADVSHTVRIVHVEDNTFYDETLRREFISTTTADFSYSKGDRAYVFSMIRAEQLVAPFLAENWEYATVVWDGTEYRVKRMSVGNLVVGVGNVGTLTGEPDDTPFTILVIREDSTLVVLDVATAPPSDTESGATVKHTLSVVLDTINTHKIPDKFQHNPDWLENDSKSAGYIVGRPFGVLLESGDVVVNVDELAYDMDEFGFAFTDINTMRSVLDKSKVIIGGKYTIVAGEYTYTGVGISGEEVKSIESEVSYPDCEIGIRVMDGDNLAGVVVVGAAGIIDLLDFFYEYRSRYYPDENTGRAYVGPVSIILSEELVDRIDPKFIPGPPEFDLTAMGLPDIPMDGSTVSVNCDTSELLSALGKGPVWYSANYVNNGMVSKASGLSSQAFTNGSFKISTINYLNGYAFLSVIAFADGVIDAFCKPLAIS